jgi:hypothetical protein
MKNNQTDGRRTRMTNGTCNTQLQLFLDHYALLTRDVALTAKVPLATLWRAVHGLPITTAHAAAIRKALWQLSGDFYVGPIEVGAEAIKSGYEGIEA